MDNTAETVYMMFTAMFPSPYGYKQWQELTDNDKRNWQVFSDMVIGTLGGRKHA